ncbi:MAG: permease [Spirochaetaceae bacterium]|jgi:putative hydroxymethylpyrimidine transporter CytX|nr:permease [Spirochaetaceae bacterium]
MKKNSMFLLWVGAAISISEIYTGGLLAPLGFGKALAAIIIGHLAGTGLLVLGGHISFARRRNAMDSAAFSLGRNGGGLAAICNVVQLTGWTMVMVVQAGSAITAIFPALPFAPVSLGLGLLVTLWALIFGSPAQWINNAVVIRLAALCVVLFWESARGTPGPAFFPGDITFALALELSIAMPVSWLPLAGDYSYRAGDSRASAVSFAGYFLGSVLMYGFGLFITLKTGGDFFTLIAASRLRFAACAVVVLSTLTTAFLDLYSAAVSSTRIITTKNPRFPILAIGLFSSVLSAVFPPEGYSGFLTNFLTAIGMVFVPIYGVIFIDFFMKRPENKSPLGINLPGFAAVLGGMGVYALCTRYQLGIPTPLSMAAVSILYIPVLLTRIRNHHL